MITRSFFIISSSLLIDSGYFIGFVSFRGFYLSFFVCMFFVFFKIFLFFYFNCVVLLSDLKFFDWFNCIGFSSSFFFKWFLLHLYNYFNFLAFISAVFWFFFRSVLILPLFLNIWISSNYSLVVFIWILFMIFSIIIVIS